MTGLQPDYLFVRKRARPMSPDERRAHILDAMVPLLKEHGRDVSTRQIAEAAGVAEGTLFRAFGDKDTMISAAIEKFFDPEPFRDQLRGIDPDEPTGDKIRQVLQLLHDRFAGTIGFMTAFRGEASPPRRQPDEQEWIGIVERLFRPGELAVPARTLAFYLRMVGFGSAMPPLTAVHAFTLDELLELVTRGVLPGAPSRSGKKD